MTSAELESYTALVRRRLPALPENWVEPRAGIDHDVAVIGGAQSGIVLQHALRQAGIGSVTVIDASEDSARTGVWTTQARMKRLRTPKTLVGPDLGNADLGFRNWFEAQHGADAFDALGNIPLDQWVSYLDWFRAIVGAEVRQGATLERMERSEGHFRLHLREGGAAKVETARKIVLATGFSGAGEPRVPAFLRDNLLPGSYAHTSADINFDRLRGKDVAILGSAASAFDAAAAALEAGAASVHLFSRREQIAARQANRGANYPGAYANYPELPDALRWEQALRVRSAGGTAPPDSIKRVLAYPNFNIHLASPWQKVEQNGDRVAVATPHARFDFDFVVAATGFRVDLAARPELAEILPHVLLWGEQYQPPADQVDGELAAHPYLGQGYQFLARPGHDARWLEDIHVFNLSAFVSFGQPVGDIPSMRRGIPAIVAQISRDLLLADPDAVATRFRGPAPTLFDASLYASAVRTELAEAQS